MSSSNGSSETASNATAAGAEKKTRKGPAAGDSSSEKPTKSQGGLDVYILMKADGKALIRTHNQSMRLLGTPSVSAVKPPPIMSESHVES